MRSLELFAGAGGLAFGVSMAGFKHAAVIELDRHACRTIRKNRDNKIAYVKEWPLVEIDVARFDFAPYENKIDLLSGGPPCQPFSLGGKHRGHADHRNLFPEALRAVRETRPKAILFENVRGLRRPSFAKYFGYVILQITYPEIRQRKNERWYDHLSRLEKYHTAGHRDGLYYRVVHRILNAADYGVPQKRDRVFIVAFRSDVGVEWSFPEPTHGKDALLWSQWKTREYWDRHKVLNRLRPKPEAAALERVERLSAFGLMPREKPWLTVRDAIFDLPEPREGRLGALFDEHTVNPGARTYPGHTGSPLDEPAKTLKAGDHGVPGGENMLALANGKVRYFTVRESARLQTFPDSYKFNESWTETMRQLGNAVPVVLAAKIASGIKARLVSVRGR